MHLRNCKTATPTITTFRKKVRIFIARVQRQNCIFLVQNLNWQVQILSPEITRNVFDFYYSWFCYDKNTYYVALAFISFYVVCNTIKQPGLNSSLPKKSHLFSRHRHRWWYAGCIHRSKFTALLFRSLLPSYELAFGSPIHSTVHVLPNYRNKF